MVASNQSLPQSSSINLHVEMGSFVSTNCPLDSENAPKFIVAPKL